MNVTLEFICEHKVSAYDFISVYEVEGDMSNEELITDARHCVGKLITKELEYVCDCEGLIKYKDRPIKHFEILPYSEYYLNYWEHNSLDPMSDEYDIEARIMVVII